MFLFNFISRGKMINLISKLYPYFGISLIEMSKHIEIIESLNDMSGLLFQILIGGLTLIKLVIDLKDKLKNKKDE